MKHITNHNFSDALNAAPRTLVIDDRKEWHDGGVGVLHPGCTALAGVYPEFDCFYCNACGQQGRVAGSWVADLVGMICGWHRLPARLAETGD